VSKSITSFLNEREFCGTGRQRDERKLTRRAHRVRPWFARRRFNEAVMAVIFFSVRNVRGIMQSSQKTKHRRRTPIRGYPKRTTTLWTNRVPQAESFDLPSSSCRAELRIGSISSRMVHVIKLSRVQLKLYSVPSSYSRGRTREHENFIKPVSCCRKHACNRHFATTYNINIQFAVNETRNFTR